MRRLRGFERREEIFGVMRDDDFSGRVEQHLVARKIVTEEDKGGG
jgi:hypothetical protein